MDNFKVNFGGDFPKSKADFDAMVKPSKRPVRILINLLLTAVFAGIAYYFMIPAMNFKDKGFYFFIGVVAVIYLVVSVATSGALRHPEYSVYAKSKLWIPGVIIALLLVVVLIGGLISSVFFNAKRYTKLMPVQTGNFQQDVDEISYDKVPRLDEAAAKALADNKLGELSTMVSQFVVSGTSYQINYKNTPVRVFPLQYGDAIKWIKNTGKGLPAYMIVDMVTQEVTVKQLEKGIRYSPSEYFNRRLERHLRFQYPTLMFDTPNFEIDENADPYWICPVLDKRIGLFGGTDVKGAVIMNAVTGESKYYDVKDVPSWVDRVYSARLLVEQYNYSGRYQKGFFNSIFGQSGVKMTTDGVGYIALDDDVWMYTGVTSVTSDASNVGFILANQRTKETKFYEIAGAQEKIAMESAQGEVQDLQYAATFPLLLNVSGEPTYFMSLKADGEVVKQYAMVNVKQRQIVGVGNTPQECAVNYGKKLKDNNIIQEEIIKTLSVTGKIQEIRSAVKDGNTTYYFRLENDPAYYAINASKNELAVILNAGDTIKITYEKKSADITQATDVEAVK